MLIYANIFKKYEMLIRSIIGLLEMNTDYITIISNYIAMIAIFKLRWRLFRFYGTPSALLQRQYSN